MIDVVKELTERVPVLENFAESVRVVSERVANAYKNEGQVLVCGNGGSAADSEHIAGELIKEFRIRRPIPSELKESLSKMGYAELADKLQGGIAAHSLVSMSGIFTALCNDVGFEVAYAQQVNACGRAGDILFALTTSGNSAAVCAAAAVARAKGIFVVGFTGETGGKLKPLCDVCLNVPERETFKVQELHLPLYHAVCALAEQIVWGN